MQGPRDRHRVTIRDQYQRSAMALGQLDRTQRELDRAIACSADQPRHKASQLVAIRHTTSRPAWRATTSTASLLPTFIAIRTASAVALTR
jgi:hypothetical protein